MFGDYYMKNWFVKDGCIRIFSDKKKREIGMLHSELCLNSIHCSDLPQQKIDNGLRTVVDHYYSHMPAYRFLSNGNIDWNILKLNMID